MKIDGKHYRTIWIHPQNPKIVQIIDQRKLPFQFVIKDLEDLESAEKAISDMLVRGAGLIGATAGYGMYLAALNVNNKHFIKELLNAGEILKSSRPTAVNLQWAVERQLAEIEKCETYEECVNATLKTAGEITDEDANMCRMIGEHGFKIIEKISRQRNGETVNILTHCNAGWLAFVDYGSATSPIYKAHDAGIDVHVWVDETRPRNQGARLTAWELLEHGVPHTVIPDNAGGHLMQHGLVDIVITGADRVTKTGDAANKIGTYLKALAAMDNNVPFYIALPSSTFDWAIADGVNEIPVEQRDGREVKYMSGFKDGAEQEFLIMPEGSNVANYGFDVTPSRLITGLITERGICDASEDGIKTIFPEKYIM
ncbi:MAG: S-methyl-5-thioribose-1-phosphate isomerase [Cyclobacteriaceae bacterium]|nr:S-methyl-5-thioribose-1-phosphate isomerase [Cyclobacteriaceae bacterium]